MAKKRFHNSGLYEGMDGRRADEARDFNMFPDSSSAVANMPQEVIYKAWPKADQGANYKLNDNISGINKQIGEDVRKMNSHRKPEAKGQF